MFPSFLDEQILHHLQPCGQGIRLELLLHLGCRGGVSFPPRLPHDGDYHVHQIVHPIHRLVRLGCGQVSLAVQPKPAECSTRIVLGQGALHCVPPGQVAGNCDRLGDGVAALHLQHGQLAHRGG